MHARTSLGEDTGKRTSSKARDPEKIYTCPDLAVATQSHLPPWTALDNLQRDLRFRTQLNNSMAVFHWEHREANRDTESPDVTTQS